MNDAFSNDPYVGQGLWAIRFSNGILVRMMERTHCENEKLQRFDLTVEIPGADLPQFTSSNTTFMKAEKAFFEAINKYKTWTKEEAAKQATLLTRHPWRRK